MGAFNKLVCGNTFRTTKQEGLLLHSLQLKVWCQETFCGKQLLLNTKHKRLCSKPTLQIWPMTSFKVPTALMTYRYVYP